MLLARVIGTVVSTRKEPTIEGIKFDFKGDDWVLLRPSGTEPLIRCYAEAGSKKELRALVKAALEKLG